LFFNVVQRKFTEFLQNWLTSGNRKPLVIRGARQVGKTWLVRELASRTKRTLLEINFEREPKLRQLFSARDPERIFDDLCIAKGITCNPEESLLFLDEIQAAPEALAGLRWFAEEMEQLPVIAAGSLLEFALADFEHSVPVGRISYAYVEPLSFEEYLLAHDCTALLDRLREWQPNEKISSAVHEKATEWFDRFAMVGGMPDMVQHDLANEDGASIRTLQRDLLQAYRDDFTKYSGHLSGMVLEQVLLHIINSLGNKFVYNRVPGNLKAQHVKQGLKLMAMAHLCQLIPHSAANGIPLASEANPRIQKVGLLDIGLAHGLWNTPAARKFPQWNDIPPTIRGGLAEQLASQQLRLACGEATYLGQVHHWRREGGRVGEIDYLAEIEGRIIPVEVKGGSAGSMKSLQIFMQEKGLDLAVRLSRNTPSLEFINVHTTQGKQAKYDLLNLPLYLTWRLRDLV